MPPVLQANSALLHGIVKGAEASGFVDLLGRIVMYNQVCHNSFYPPPAEEESANAQENNPNVASEVKRVLLPDGTVLDAEASGTVSVGTFKSFKEVTESGDVVQSRGGQVQLPSSCVGCKRNECCFHRNDTSASGFQEALRLEFIPADFGGSLLASLMDGPRQLLLADPITACEALRNREQDVAGSVLVIERYVYVVHYLRLCMQCLRVFAEGTVLLRTSMTS